MHSNPRSLIWRGYRRVSLAALLLASVAIGCDGSSAAPGSEQTCESNCDREVNAGCSKTPEGFATSCKGLCTETRSNYPNCLSQLDAYSACVASKITFRCDANGVLSVTPVGGCASPGVACLNCTGDFLACAD
jgi:hypothetical protein